MGREGILAYLTARLRLLEAWKDSYTEYEPGDPELAAAIEKWKDQVDTLDQTVKVSWYSEEINDSSDLRDLRERIRDVLEIINEKHNNYRSVLKRSLENLSKSISDVRKAKAFNSHVLSGREDVSSSLDTKA
jgi:UDP-N-acetyl-D-mannosaminuronate dehydrogenase